jgi:hypothetical protein
MFWFVNKAKLKDQIKQEILKDLKQVIIPCVVAEVLNRLSETEQELDRIISHNLNNLNNIRT